MPWHRATTRTNFAAAATALLAGIAAAGPLRAQADTVDLRGFFPNMDASFVLAQGRDGRVVRHDPARAALRFVPASTFKIPNTIIALETGVVDGPDFALRWDSAAIPRGAFFPHSWARDQTLESAFANSVFWFYQELARRIGADRMRAWLARLDYGNRDTGGGIDRFWLYGDMRISADEQVAFLRRFWSDELGLAPRTTSIVKGLMRLAEGADWTLYGKTGTAEVTSTRELGWLVGVIEARGNTWFYALHMEGERVWEDWPPQTRKNLVLALLRELGVLPSD